MAADAALRAVQWSSTIIMAVGIVIVVAGDAGDATSGRVS